MQQQTSTREVQRKERKKTQQERGGVQWCDKIIGGNYSTTSRRERDGGRSERYLALQDRNGVQQDKW